MSRSASREAWADSKEWIKWFDPVERPTEGTSEPPEVMANRFGYYNWDDAEMHACCDRSRRQWVASVPRLEGEIVAATVRMTRTLGSHAVDTMMDFINRQHSG